MIPNVRRHQAGLGLALGVLAALCTPAWSQSSAAKKDLVARAVQLQTPDIEAMAKGLVEQPAAQMLQEASQVMQERIPADQRDTVGKRIQASAKKYVDEAAPLLKDRAVKLAPSTLGNALEEKFSEEELKQLVAWLESPVSRKYQQALPEIQSAFVQKLVADARPLIDPKLQVLEQSIRTALGLPPPSATKTPPVKPTAPSGSKPVGK